MNGIRAEDVNEANPVGVRNMSLEAESLPSTAINDSVVLIVLHCNGCTVTGTKKCLTVSGEWQASHTG